MCKKQDIVCPGCQRPEIHKFCPAWGTPLYMSGELLTKEAELRYADMRKAALERIKHDDGRTVDGDW